MERNDPQNPPTSEELKNKVFASAKELYDYLESIGFPGNAILADQRSQSLDSRERLLYVDGMTGAYHLTSLAIRIFEQQQSN